MIACTLLSAACAPSDTGEGEGEGDTAAGCDDVDLGSRACTIDDNCDIVQVELDCCGSLAFVGVASTGSAVAQSRADQCADGLNDCDCAPDNPRADDGTTSNFGTPAVRCVGETCTTTFP